ncbi:hypothetical protein [Aquimarina sp. AU119]|uniref:hypothetical protein n=1 Tax=Aquimarina sp. AU119 TaxID=2108528 RepID=UPI000D691ABB|nr:hypothetical protein [Aquimarina sp. AU119]
MRLNYRILTLLIAVSSFLFGVKAQNDLAQLELKGSVKSLKEITYHATLDPKNNIIQKDSFNQAIELVFIQSGRLLKKSHWFDTKKNMGSKHTYTYDTLGFLNKIYNYSLDDHQESETVYTYNSQGEKIRTQEFIDGKLSQDFSYKYNSKGQVIEFIEHSINGKFIIEKTIFIYSGPNVFEKKIYNLANQLESVQTCTYDSNGNNFIDEHRNGVGEVDLRVHYTYENNKLHETNEYWFNKSKTTHYKMTYNEHGDQIESHMYYSDATPTEYNSTTYEYDNNNNWIKKIVYKNEIPMLVCEREIAYYE